VIVAVSTNPAIARIALADGAAAGGLVRARELLVTPGGKAAHVAMAAAALGERVTWVGFLGGSTGAECERGLVSLGIPVAVVKTAAETRMNMEIVEADGTVTEVLEPGGHVSEGEVERMLSLCRDLFTEYRGAAQVALSGSLPPGAPVDFYAQLVRLAHAHGCRALLDTSGEALRAALGESPDLVKPNRDEAEALTGVPPDDARSAAEAARLLFDAGARAVAISLGAEGMFWQATRDSAPLVARPPLVEARSAVGCGDASLAGFAVAHRRGLSGREFVRFAAACGTANCLADAPGMIDRREVERLLPQSAVEGINGRG
jgi:1-phosphofructokinase family hexose kinase